MVAYRKDVANGAKIMEKVKTKWDSIHAVRRDGLFFSTLSTTGASPAGGRGVKSGFSPSGFCTNHGSTMEPPKVMMENTINDRLPTRPI